MKGYDDEMSRLQQILEQQQRDATDAELARIDELNALREDNERQQQETQEKYDKMLEDHEERLQKMIDENNEKNLKIEQENAKRQQAADSKVNELAKKITLLESEKVKQESQYMQNLLDATNKS